MFQGTEKGLAMSNRTIHQQEMTIRTSGTLVRSSLAVPEGARSIIVFAHGSGSSRFSPRNRLVAETLNDGGLATLLMDLLTSDEEELDMFTRHLRFDIGLLAHRLSGAVDWLKQDNDLYDMRIGLFGSSTGAAAALKTAAERPEVIGSVVSRGGRPDLAGDALEKVRCPVLLIVGGSDETVIELNRQAAQAIHAEQHLSIVPGATHLFEEPGALEQVARLARDWFVEHLGV